MPVRDGLLPLSSRDSVMTPPRADGGVPPRDVTFVPCNGDANAVPSKSNALTFSRGEDIVERRTTDVRPLDTDLLPPRGVTSLRSLIIAPCVDTVWSQNDVGCVI